MAPSPVPTKQLGVNGPHVTALGFGAMNLASVIYGIAEEDEKRFALLDAVYDSGCRFIDTSDAYGDSEELLGRWLQLHPGRREQIVLATKFGIKMDPSNPNNREFCDDPEFIRVAIENSLRKLQTSYVDLWYCHRLSGKNPVEIVVATMAEAVAAGKVRHLGISECSPTSLRRACAVHRIAATQVEYSPFTLDIESATTSGGQAGDHSLLSAARELGVAIVAYSPLGRGMLTGRFKGPEDFEEGDWRRNAPRFNKENFPKNLLLVEKLANIARDKGCSVGQLTLAWLSKQGDDVISIPGSRRPDGVRENMRALEVELSDAEVRDIRQTVENCEVVGDRYPGVMMGMCFMDTPPLPPK